MTATASPRRRGTTPAIPRRSRLRGPDSPLDSQEQPIGRGDADGVERLARGLVEAAHPLGARIVGEQLSEEEGVVGQEQPAAPDVARGLAAVLLVALLVGVQEDGAERAVTLQVREDVGRAADHHLHPIVEPCLGQSASRDLGVARGGLDRP